VTPCQRPLRITTGILDTREIFLISIVVGRRRFSSARSLARSPSPRHHPLTQYPRSPRPLLRSGKTSPRRARLVVSHSTCPPLSFPPSRAQLSTRSCSNKQQRPILKHHARVYQDSWSCRATPPWPGCPAGSGTRAGTGDMKHWQYLRGKLVTGSAGARI
jgi:hypothetical protein